MLSPVGFFYDKPEFGAYQNSGNLWWRCDLYGLGTAGSGPRPDEDMRYADAHDALAAP